MFAYVVAHDRVGALENGRDVMKFSDEKISQVLIKCKMEKPKKA